MNIQINIKIRFIILVLYLIIPISTYSQNIKIKELEKDFKTASQTRKANIAYKIALNYYTSNSQECENYAMKALKYSKSNTKLQIKTYHLLALYYMKNKDYRKAAKNYKNEYDLIKDGTNKRKIAQCLFDIGRAYNKHDYNRFSTKYFEESLEVSKSINYHYLIKRTYNLLFEVYYERRKYKEAISYLLKYVKISELNYKSEKEFELEEVNKLLTSKDSLLNQQEAVIVKKDSIVKKVTNINKKQKLEIDNLNLSNMLHKEKLNNQRLSILLLIFIAALTIVSLFFVYNRYLQKRKHNILLTNKNLIISQQNEEIKAQVEEINVQNEQITKSHKTIEERNKNITDSIVYAKKIQDAVIPSINLLKNTFKQNFVLNKPKDIVSGDFYWMYKSSHKVFLITADCTGHGIPGAFMSLLSISFLNEIVPQSIDLNAAQILNLLREKIKFTLHQEAKKDSQKDGLDAAFCIIDKENYTLDYAGANNSLYIIREKDKLPELSDLKRYRTIEINNYALLEIKADKQPIAVYIKEREFTNHHIKILKNDKLFMFSDGIIDQFGGPNNKKFMPKKFKNILLETHSKTMNQQKTDLENTFNSWKGVNDQIDDVLIVGIKI